MIKVGVIGGAGAGLAAVARLLGTAEHPIQVTKVEDLQPMFTVAAEITSDPMHPQYPAGHGDPIWTTLHGSRVSNKPSYTMMHKRWGR